MLRHSIILLWFFLSTHKHIHSYNITRLEESLLEMGVVSPIDLLGLTESEVASLNMKSLEHRRWERLMKYLQLTPSIPYCRAVLPPSNTDQTLREPSTSSSSFIKNSSQSISPTIDDIDCIKEVVWKTKWFRQRMETKVWDRELLGYVLNEISDFVSMCDPTSHHRSRASKLFAGLLESLQDHKLMESLLAEMLRSSHFLILFSTIFIVMMSFVL